MFIVPSKNWIRMKCNMVSWNRNKTVVEKMTKSINSEVLSIVINFLVLINAPK